MASDTLKVVPKKPIDAALEILRDNGYMPTGVHVGDIMEWQLPGSDTSIGIFPMGGTRVAVIMDFANKKSDYYPPASEQNKGKSKYYSSGSNAGIEPSFIVTKMGELMDFAKDFVKNAQSKGIPLPREDLAAKKQKIGPV